MKKITFLLITILFFEFTANVTAQEKNEQLWYCWEETVKPEMIDQYLELSNDFLELYKSENFPFAIYTWQAQPFVYELWTPINTLADIDKIAEASMKIVEKLGDEKYAAFNNTKLYNREYTCTIKNDISYNPKNPDYNFNELIYEQCRILFIKSGKQKEYEEAQKWINKVREEKDYGCWLFTASGGFGYEEPCYIVMNANTNRENSMKALEKFQKENQDIWNKFVKKIQPLLRKPPVVYDWHLLKDLSYEPIGN